jgi:hypothetical protein
LEKVIGALGFIVGCGAGAIGGLIAAARRAHGWEPWAIAD